MVGAQVILKCIMLAKFQVLVLEIPVDEYAMANINQIHNGVQFESTVFEGRLNSVMIENLELGVKTMSYSFKDYEQRSLSTRLDIKNEQATLDCELI